MKSDYGNCDCKDKTPLTKYIKGGASEVVCDSCEKTHSKTLGGIQVTGGRNWKIIFIRRRKVTKYD